MEYTAVDKLITLEDYGCSNDRNSGEEVGGKRSMLHGTG